MHGRWTRGIALLALLSIAGLALVSVAGTVGAQEDTRININWEDDYDGISEGGSQAITLNVTLVAEQKTSGITVEFDETSNSFIAPNSYEVTADESDWENPYSGGYTIEQLDTGDEITFTFDVYPRVLDQNSLVVSKVDIDAENPQTYEQSVNVDANLTSSPWIQYQNELGNGNGGESVPRGIVAGGVLFGIGGLIAAAYFRRSKETALDEKHDEGNEKFDELKQDLDAAKSVEKVKEVKKEWNEDDDGFDY